MAKQQDTLSEIGEALCKSLRSAKQFFSILQLIAKQAMSHC